MIRNIKPSNDNYKTNKYVALSTDSNKFLELNLNTGDSIYLMDKAIEIIYNKSDNSFYDATGKQYII